MGLGLFWASNYRGANLGPISASTAAAIVMCSNRPTPDVISILPLLNFYIESLPPRIFIWCGKNLRK